MSQLSSSADFQLGAAKAGPGLYSFKVWAPFCSKVDLKLFVSGGKTLIAMEKDDEGYFQAEVSNISSGTRYLYVLDGQKERPDPVSRFQPEGVHGPSGVVDHDDCESGHVRRFVIENASHWISEYHIDVLRLDAVHGIYDFSAKHILQELNDAIQGLAKKLGRRIHVIAESDLNDSSIIRSKKQGGYELSGQWNDDFHHAVHAYLTGERLSTLVDFDKQKLAAALLILSPNTPLLFMGQEYGERAPFQYFIDHGDANLIRAVREGRRKEFAAFGWENIPDPESEKTFLDSKLNWDTLRNNNNHLWCLYKDVISLRRSIKLNSRLPGIRYNEENQWIALEYTGRKESHFGIIISFLSREQNIAAPFRMKIFNEIFNTASIRYGEKIKQKAKTYRKEISLPSCSVLAGKITGR